MVKDKKKSHQDKKREVRGGTGRIGDKRISFCTTTNEEEASFEQFTMMISYLEEEDGREKKVTFIIWLVATLPAKDV